eukprot:jgi/Bigna1/82841/fgenesh1_pg.98_\
MEAEMRRVAVVGIGALASALLATSLYRHYCGYRRRLKRKILVMKLSQSIDKMSKALDLLRRRSERLKATNESKWKRAMARLGTVKKELANISPQLARRMLRQGVVVASVRGLLWERALGGEDGTSPLRIGRTPGKEEEEGGGEQGDEKRLRELAAWGEGSEAELKYLHTIHADLPRTFPTIPEFKAGGSSLPRLELVLRAYAATDKQIRDPFYSHRDVFGEGKRKGSLGFPLACQLGWMLDRNSTNNSSSNIIKTTASILHRIFQRQLSACFQWGASLGLVRQQSRSSPSPTPSTLFESQLLMLLLDVCHPTECRYRIRIVF